MRIIPEQELKDILDKHGKWLQNEENGVRADLSSADLSYADLRYADLRYANLSSANLSCTNLRYANLSSADLSYANLRFANLSSADLSYANLGSADLRDTNMIDAVNTAENTIDTINITATNTPTTNTPTGVKHDQEKPDMALLSAIGLVKIAEVMTYGKKKYSANNWRGGIAWTRVLSAALRHLVAYIGGEDKDPETGFSHMAHLGCCVLFILEFENTHVDLDDRWKGTNK